MATPRTATARRIASDPPVIDPEQSALERVFGEAEGQLAATFVAAFKSFLGGLQAFVVRAQELEVKAAATLEKAASLRSPATAAEDETLQSFIRTANTDRKATEDHWSICSAVHGLHRRLTARRDKPVTAFERAAAIAQQLHNTYVENERRRAREEEERQRREAEERARQDRELELADAERQALEHEAASKDLSEREQQFVELIFAGYNTPANAARQAGYKDPRQGERLMGTLKIQQAIEAKRAAQAIRRQAEAKRQAPLEVEHVSVRPNVSRASGAVDRTTHGAEILDERLFIEAAVGGKHGIPLDCLMANPTKLNEYSRSLHERINLWPGIRYVKRTKTV